MWKCVAPEDIKGPAPSARSKHSATLVGEYFYLLGGRNGNLPLKDFWKYHLVTGKWNQLKPTGDHLPCLQEHTAVAYKEKIYIFGGEVGFSAGTETPLWLYDIKANTWKKIRTKKGVATPKGRRGHSALVHNGSMLIYGGYQDLRGSCNELWAYHFETESWHLISTVSSKNSDSVSPARHKHSAVLHSDAMWVYGGMTDLQERSDLWKWDIISRTWHCVKSKINPGPLHSHAACKLPSGMLIFGGERNGQNCNELWKFSFALETWEKVNVSGLKPHPRSESVALAVPSLILSGSYVTTIDTRGNGRVRIRSCTSADRGNRHSSYLPNNKVAPYEKTYIFEPSQGNYNDGSDIAQQYSEKNRSSRNFLQEISKISQINIPRMSNKCSYTVLTGCAGDSTESLLKQHSSTSNDVEILDTEIATPSRGTMIKSKSAYVIKKKYQTDISPTQDGDTKDPVVKKKVEFACTASKLPRDPISVPNFSTLNLATPVLTPVETTKLVYLDSDEEKEFMDIEGRISNKILEKNNLNIYENFKPLKRGDSYCSHLGYADNPLYQQMIQESSAEYVSSTSDYASIETVNRLSSASSYSVKTGNSQDDNLRNKEPDRPGPFGFCNPNYLGPDTKPVLDEESKKNVMKLLTKEEPVQTSEEEDSLELQNLNNGLSKDTKVYYRHSCRPNRPPKSLSLDQSNNPPSSDKCRALSASRVERKANPESDFLNDNNVPVFIYVIGGKEQGQITVFQRPVSIWRLKIF